MGTSEEMPNIANWKTRSFIPLISQISDLAVESCSEDRNGPSNEMSTARSQIQLPISKCSAVPQEVLLQRRGTLESDSSLWQSASRPWN